MAKVLVIHGAGMNMRGKVQTEIFGPMTLPEYDERIRGYAAELGLEVEIFHSNIEGEIVNKLYEANDKAFDAALFNPAAFGTGYPALVAAISQVRFPTIEVHISNPVRRGPASETARVSHGIFAGVGLPGYCHALPLSASAAAAGRSSLPYKRRAARSSSRPLTRVRHPPPRRSAPRTGSR